MNLDDRRSNQEALYIIVLTSHHTISATIPDKMCCFNFVHFSKYHQSYTSYYLQTIPKRFFFLTPLPRFNVGSAIKRPTNEFRPELTNIEWGGGGMCQQFCPGLSELYSRNNSHSARTIERKHISVTFLGLMNRIRQTFPVKSSFWKHRSLNFRLFRKGSFPGSQKVRGGYGVCARNDSDSD